MPRVSVSLTRIDSFLNAVDTTIPKGRYTMLNLNGGAESIGKLPNVNSVNTPGAR
jgi:hypothetical protein